MYQFVTVYKNFGDLGVKLYADRTVQLGPFQGMKFRSPKAKGSKIFPKLIGCYEESLHSAFYELIDNPYKKIIDIGCGDGYYAVGFPRMFRQARVYAYDLDPNAIRAAKHNAQLNGVQDQLELRNMRYDQENLREEDFSERTLLMYDAVGDELNLFNEHTVPLLQNVDLIIELHDFIDANTKSRILELFGDSHSISVYPQLSLSPIVQSFLMNDRETRQLLKLMDDGRPETMEWVLLKSRKQELINSQKS